MGKLSKPVVVLLVLAVFAVVASLVGVVVATMSRAGRPGEAGTDIADTSQQKPAANRTAAGQPRRTQTKSAPRIAVTKGQRRVDGSGLPKPQANGQDDASAAEDAKAAAESAKVAAATEAGRAYFQLGGPGRSPGGVGNLAAARRLRGMSLTEGQRAAIAQFEESFKITAQQRTEHSQQSVEEMGKAVRDAYASGDQRLIAEAQTQMHDIARSHAEVNNQLNREYVDGVRQYLTEEQAKQVDATVSQSPGGAVVGVAVMQSGDNAPKVEVIHQEITVEPPPPPPPPEEESAE